MAKYLVEDTSLTAIADAIREKTGNTEALTLEEMSAAIGEITSGGTGGMLVCEATDSTSSLTLADLNGLRISFPNVSTVNGEGFYKCTGLVSVDFPAATTIDPSAFCGCTNLVSVNSPMVAHIDTNVFDGCTSLASVNIPRAMYIGYKAFNGCSALTSVEFPIATVIDEDAFHGCAGLTSVDISNATEIYNRAFYGCTELTSIDLPKAAIIADGAFYGCTNLSAIILRNTKTVCQLIVTAVVDTKIVTAEGIPTGEGFVYVPSTLFEGYVELIAYQAAKVVGDAATAEYIARTVLRKIEDYPEICGT